MFDDSDWFNFLIRLIVAILALCFIFVLGLIVGGATLLSRVGG